jgi:hypothetical protein
MALCRQFQLGVVTSCKCDHYHDVDRPRRFRVCCPTRIASIDFGNVHMHIYFYSKLVVVI